MCIINSEIESVSKTKILVGLSKDKKRQITVYSNIVNTPVSNNFMVLPVPYPESVQFINLSDYKKLFDDCASCFYSNERGMEESFSFNNSYSMPNSKLEVLNIGSYKVSLAMSLDDLKRVDKSVFELSSGCSNVLEKTYKEKYWGFIICKLSKGNEEYHPFAYSHNMLDKQVFIPCKHFHYERNIIKHVNARNVSHSPMFAGFGFSNDILGNYNSIDDSPMFAGFDAPSNNTMNDKIADDWGHDIYLYNIPNARFKLNGVTSSNEKIWDGKNPLQLHKINFDFDVLKVFDKLKIVGRHPNVDLFITV
jgi:hypothetical protein